MNQRLKQRLLPQLLHHFLQIRRQRHKQTWILPLNPRVRRQRLLLLQLQLRMLLLQLQLQMVPPRPRRKNAPCRAAAWKTVVELEPLGTKTLSIVFPTRRLAALMVPTRATRTTTEVAWNARAARRTVATLERFTIQVLDAVFPNKTQASKRVVWWIDK